LNKRGRRERRKESDRGVNVTHVCSQHGTPCHNEYRLTNEGQDCREGPVRGWVVVRGGDEYD
jgi:hypothetical protein